MTTHDYTNRYWGHDYAVVGIHENNVIALMGWGRGLEKGDFILLDNKGDSTRYKLLKVEYLGNPGDMWSAKAEFAPRPGRVSNFAER